MQMLSELSCQKGVLSLDTQGKNRGTLKVCGSNLGGFTSWFSLLIGIIDSYSIMK